MNSQTLFSLLLALFLAAVVVCVVGFIFYCFETESYIYAPYQFTVPDGAFQPLGAVSPLSDEEAAARQQYLQILTDEGLYTPV